MNLIPKVKKLELSNGFLKNKKLAIATSDLDDRIFTALQKLPLHEEGTAFTIEIKDRNSEAYQLDINEDSIVIHAESCSGAFYAIQTLRQIYHEELIPCLHIEDYPDFAYRGFYHDMTRGKIATVDTIKKLVDKMACYKLNSLQLYVEHVFTFEENRSLWETTRYLTKEDIQEIDAYCRLNFIDFIPSLSTFGHMRDILEQDQYKYLRVLKDYDKKANFWNDRMAHHTIDPTMPESFELVKSLVNQYNSCFTSETFNICCDETFDLKHLEQKGLDVADLYLSFVEKIAGYVHSLEKKVMMWGDILLEYPQAITKLPENVEFLNWYYHNDAEVMERMISTFAELGRTQIVCPGTNTWNRFCEDIDLEEDNIGTMSELGYKYNAGGVLNTNWGDWGNPCCLELGMYGMVLGAAKSWTVDMPIDSDFYAAVNTLLYGCASGVSLLRQVSRFHSQVNWCSFVRNYFYHKYHEGDGYEILTEEAVRTIQKSYQGIMDRLESSEWYETIYKDELISTVEAVCVMAELQAKLFGYSITRLTNTSAWMKKYADSWIRSNYESELENIIEVFRYFEQLN